MSFFVKTITTINNSITKLWPKYCTITTITCMTNRWYHCSYLFRSIQYLKRQLIIHTDSSFLFSFFVFFSNIIHLFFFFCHDVIEMLKKEEKEQVGTISFSLFFAASWFFFFLFLFLFLILIWYKNKGISISHTAVVCVLLCYCTTEIMILVTYCSM